MQRKTIYPILAFAAVLMAMGSDCLLTAGMAVRADAVVTVAQRMAEEFGKTRSRRQSQRAFPLEQARVYVLAIPPRLVAANTFLHPARLCSPHVLYLPPPLA